MLSLPPAVRVFVARGATDMRKSFDTLAALVIDVVDEDPMSGHLFLFVNRRKNRAKILWWDRSGYCLLAKRLEPGQLSFFEGQPAPDLEPSTTPRAEPHKKPGHGRAHFPEHLPRVVTELGAR